MEFGGLGAPLEPELFAVKGHQNFYNGEFIFKDLVEEGIVIKEGKREVSEEENTNKEDPLMISLLRKMYKHKFYLEAKAELHQKYEKKLQ